MSILHPDDQADRSEERPSDWRWFAPSVPSAWDEFAVPWLRWMVGGSVDDVALIVLMLGREA